MATQYSPILKLALPVTGELQGTWGNVVNDSITSMLEEAIAGRKVINSWTSNSHSLTVADGVTSESRAAILELTDTGTALTGAGTLTCPSNSKVYIVKNRTGQTITIKTSAGTGVAVLDGENTLVFCDGTDVISAVSSLPTLNLGGIDLLANGTSFHIDSTGAVEMPSGTTAQRPSPVAGMFRYNSEEGEFEGYDGTEWGAIAGGGGEVSFVTTTFTATAGQTTFTVDYTVGAVIVYLNGVQLVPVTDYTATNGTSIALTTGASLDDILVVQAFNTFEVANAITQAQADNLYATTAQGALADTSVQPSDLTNYTNTATSKTLAVNEKCLVTASGQTITLPASPSEDDVVGVIVENFTDTVVARNGSTIMELAEDLTLDKEYLSLDFVYQSGSWRFV